MWSHLWFPHDEEVFNEGASSVTYEVELPEQGLLETIVYRNYPPAHYSECLLDDLMLVPNTRTSVIRSIRPIDKPPLNPYRHDDFPRNSSDLDSKRFKKTQPVEIISYRRVDGDEKVLNSRENQNTTGKVAPKKHRVATHQLPIVIPPKFRDFSRFSREVQSPGCSSRSSKGSRSSPLSSSTPSPQSAVIIDTDLLIPSPDRLTSMIQDVANKRL